MDETAETEEMDIVIVATDSVPSVKIVHQRKEFVEKCALFTVGFVFGLLLYVGINGNKVLIVLENG